MNDLTLSLKEKAHQMGFDLVGVAAATKADGFERLQDWLARGYAGAMDYMHRHEEARRHPSSILPEVRSVVMVGVNYRDGQGTAEPPPPPLHGKVARYARGQDYHDLLRARLKELASWLREQQPGCRARAVVDTAPLLERDFARRAGLGWFGKNTMLLNKHQGSYFFLGALLVDVDLQPDAPHEANHCGTCTACLDTCPTDAFTGPGWLDSRRCISYLTIELRDAIPEELRAGMGQWVFGCDICQEVCPWNRKPPRHTNEQSPPIFQPSSDLENLNLAELFYLSEEALRERFRGTPLTRPRRGLLRNAAIVLGNQKDPAAIPALRHALADPDPAVREAAEWALGRITADER